MHLDPTTWYENIPSPTFLDTKNVRTQSAGDCITKDEAGKQAKAFNFEQFQILKSSFLILSIPESGKFSVSTRLEPDGTDFRFT